MSFEFFNELYMILIYNAVKTKKTSICLKKRVIMDKKFLLLREKCCIHDLMVFFKGLLLVPIFFFFFLGFFIRVNLLMLLPNLYQDD